MASMVRPIKKPADLFKSQILQLYINSTTSHFIPEKCLFIALSVTHSPRLSWLLVFGLVAGCAGTLGRLGACGLLPFARAYGRLRFPTSRPTLLYAWRLVADRRPVRLSWITPGRSPACLGCRGSADVPWDDSAALVRGLRANRPNLVLFATSDDALPVRLLWIIFANRCITLTHDKSPALPY